MGKRGLLTVVLLTIPIVAVSSLLGLGQAPPPPLPPQFVLYVKYPEPANNGGPTLGNWVVEAVAAADGRLFVLDGGNDRILELDEAGKVTAVLCETGDCQFVLDKPQAMTIQGRRLYVANPSTGLVVVLSLEGELIETIKVALPGPAEQATFSPTELAVSSARNVYVADASRSLVVQLRQGDRAPAILLDRRSEREKYQASGPAGLAVDARDNLYVANSANGWIRKYSPEGRHLQEFAMRGNPLFFAPASLALDPRGFVYFVDERTALVRVYDDRGDLTGSVGFLDAQRSDSPSVLRDPVGLALNGDTLYVADRAAGLFGFRIDPAYWWRMRRSSGGVPHS